MKPSGATFAMLVFSCAVAAMRAAGAGQPADLAKRNETYAAAPTITPEVRAKEGAETLQNRRVDFSVREKAEPAVPADRRAAVEVNEARAKTVLPTESSRPAARTKAMSALNHRVSDLDPKDRLAPPTTVAKYQDGMRGATTIGAGGAVVIEKPGLFSRLNRFVFQRHRVPAAGAPIVSVRTGKVTVP
jgi:hypothetical protein